MYHNPNLPAPFHSCLGGYNRGQRPMPGPSCSETPASTDRYKSNNCKETQVCSEPPICEKKPICNEKQRPERVCNPPKEKECCEKNYCDCPLTVNELLVNKPSNCSCNNGNQMPLALLLLYFFGLH